MFERNEVAGSAIDDDFENASGSAGNDGCLARHGFEINDAERLINRRAAEDGAVAVKLNCLLLGDHLFDPDYIRVVSAGLIDFAAHFGGDLRRVRRAGAEHDLRVWRQVTDGVYKMRHAFLACDAAHEQDIRLAEIDTEAGQRGCIAGLLILREIDAVVDDVNAIRINIRISPEDVRLRSFGDGDDGVSIENCRPLHP